MKRAFVAFAVIACAACISSIGFGEGDPSKAGTDKVSEASGSGGFEMEKPAREHVDLKKFVGSWDAEMSMESGPGQPPMISKGTSTIKSMGEFWVVEDTEYEMFGMKFVGHGVYGFDATRNKHVSFWADSAGSWPMYSEGGMDPDGKTLVLKSEGPAYPDMTKRVTYTLKGTWPDDDTRVMKMFAPGPDGKEIEVWQMTAKRRK